LSNKNDQEYFQTEIKKLKKNLLIFLDLEKIFSFYFLFIIFLNNFRMQKSQPGLSCAMNSWLFIPDRVELISSTRKSGQKKPASSNTGHIQNHHKKRPSSGLLLFQVDSFKLDPSSAEHSGYGAP